MNISYGISAATYIQKWLPWRVSQRIEQAIDTHLRNQSRIYLEKTLSLSVDSQNALVEIHQLLGRRHVGMGIWSLKSLIKTANLRLAVVIHDDGSLTQEDTDLMHRHLPGVRIIMRAEADLAVRKMLSDYRACTNFRFGEVLVTNHRGQSYNMFIMALILFDINLLARSDKIIILDADVLFFRRPDIIVDWATNPTDRRSLYSVEAYKPKREKNGSLSFDKKAAHTLNSGLICFSKSALFNLETIEDWIASNQDLMYTSPVFEQLCYSYLIKRQLDSVELDPALYGFNYTSKDSVFTHFGIKRGFFENISRVATILSCE